MSPISKRLVLCKDNKIVKKPSSAKPDLSVVVIAFNEEKRVKACLESLREQVFEGKLEVILADGSSTDRTVELALPLVDGLVALKEGNCAAQRNAGSLLCRAEVIAFCDADNIVDWKWAQEIHDFFRQKENEEKGKREGKDEERGNKEKKNGKTGNEEGKKRTIGVFGVSGVYDAANPLEGAVIFFAMNLAARLESLRGRFFPANGNYAFTREAWFKLDGMDPSFKTCEDHDFFARAAKIGKIDFNPRMKVLTSARRLRKMGYIGFLKFQLANSERFYRTGEASKAYENIR